MKFENNGIRFDLQLIASWIEPGSKVLDLGCGDGNLLHFLKKHQRVEGTGIEKEEEMLNLGWQEIIADPQNLICIEWPERIAGIMPPHIVIKFEHGENENERKIGFA